MFNSFKEKWLEEKEKKLKLEFKERLDKLWMESASRENEQKKRIEDLEQSLSKKLENLKLDEEIASRRREELERESLSLKEQLRIIEAKAHPSSVWTEAFGQGFSKAWDSIKEVVYKDYENVKKMIYERAVEETLSQNPRIKTMGEIKLKIEDLEVRRSQENLPENIEKYSNYIEALRWILDGNNQKTK